MADSIKLYVPIAPMSSEDFVACSFPFEAMQGFNHRIDRDPFYRWVKVKSPLTGAGFKVISVMSSDHHRLAGYQISVNIPACAVGHNYLLVNGVPYASKLAFLLLSHWLLTEGATPKAVQALQFEKAKLKSVTVTYLLLCDSVEDAHAARREFAQHSEALHNAKSKGPQPAFSVGPAEKATSYIKKRNYTISSYVKDGSVEGAFVDFPTLEDEALIRTEAGFYLRVEVELYGVWLASHGLDSADRWLLGDGKKNSYERVFQLIRNEMRLDANLRQRAPKEQAISQMREPDQSFLRWHLSGMDVRNHPLVLAKETVHEQNSYFSAIKQRLLKKMKIDISLEWEKQSKHLSHRLIKLLFYTGDYEPELQFAEKVYSRVSAPKCCEILDGLIIAMILNK